MKPDTIQDLLTKAGYTIDQDKKQFAKSISFMETKVIPFDELAGHTVDSFVEKAKRHQWLPESFSFTQLAAMTNSEWEQLPLFQSSGRGFLQNVEEEQVFIKKTADEIVVSSTVPQVEAEITIDSAPFFSAIGQVRKKLAEMATINEWIREGKLRLR